MRFTPKTNEELQREALLEPGYYDFEVVSAEDAVSKSGSEMIALKLRIFSDRGERSVRDWLLPNMSYKLRHFAETTGLLPAYEAGTFNAEDCKGRTGRVLLKIETQEGYQPKNSVRDYEKQAVRKPEGFTEDVKKFAESQPKIPSASAGNPEIPF